MKKGIKIADLRSAIIILCLWFSAFASLYSDTANKIALYIALPIAFCLCLIQQKRAIDNKYFKILLALIIWIFFSYLWAQYKDTAIVQLKQLLGTFILAYIYKISSQDVKVTPYLYITYIVLFISACIYARNNILIEMVSETDRLDDDKLNANTLAYFLFYATFALFELKRFVKNRLANGLLEISFMLMIPVTFIIAILTASRQVLIIQIPLIVILLYLRYIHGTKLFTKVVFSIVATVSIIMAVPYVSKVYEDSYLKTRNEIELNEDGRFILLKDAIDVGNKNFPLGVGPANYIHYSPNKLISHNTYTELYANEGIVGLGLYLWLILVFIKRQWNRYRLSRDKQYLIFFIFGIIYTIDGLFFVFYPHLWLMGFFILVASHSEAYYRELSIIKLHK